MAWSVNKWRVAQGEEIKFLVHLFDDADNSLNVAGATGVYVHVKKADGTVLEKAAETGLTWGSLCPLYIYAFRFTAEETALLSVKPVAQDIWVKLVFGANSYLYKIPNSMLVTGAGL
jgi:hypothetical protein